MYFDYMLETIEEARVLYFWKEIHFAVPGVAEGESKEIFKEWVGRQEKFNFKKLKLPEEVQIGDGELRPAPLHIGP